MNDELEDLIEDLKEAPSRDVAIRKAYDVLAKKYPGKRLTAILYPWLLFENDLDILWDLDRIPCTAMNVLLASILINSGWVKEEEIEFKWMVLWFTPHQYIRVKCDDHWLDLDVWGANHGVPYAEHCKFFT